MTREMQRRELIKKYLTIKLVQLEVERVIQTKVPHRCLYWASGKMVMIFIKTLEWNIMSSVLTCYLKVQVRLEFV